MFLYVNVYVYGHVFVFLWVCMYILVCAYAHKHLIPSGINVHIFVCFGFLLLRVPFCVYHKTKNKLPEINSIIEMIRFAGPSPQAIVIATLQAQTLAFLQAFRQHPLADPDCFFLLLSHSLTPSALRSVPSEVCPEQLWEGEAFGECLESGEVLPVSSSSVSRAVLPAAQPTRVPDGAGCDGRHPGSWHSVSGD